MNNSWNNQQYQQSQQSGQFGQVKLFDPTQFQTPAANIQDPAVSKQPQSQVQNPGGANFQTAHPQNDWGQGAPPTQPAQGSWANWGSWDWNDEGANMMGQNPQQLSSQSHPQQHHQQHYSQSQAVASNYHQSMPDAGGVYSNAWDPTWDGSGRMYAQPNQMYPGQSNAVQPEQAYYSQNFPQPSYDCGNNQVQQGEQVPVQQDLNNSQYVNQGQPQNYSEQGQASQEGHSFTDSGQSQVFYDQPSIPHVGYDPSSFVDSGPWPCNVEQTPNQQAMPDSAHSNTTTTDNIVCAETSNFQYHDQTQGSSSSANTSGMGNSSHFGYEASTSQVVQPTLVAPSLDVYSDNDGDGTVAGFFGRGDDDGDVSSESSRPSRSGPVLELQNTDPQNSHGNLLTVDKSIARTNSEISNASLSTLNMSADDDGREHLQNLQELVQRMESVDINNRNVKENHKEGASHALISNVDSSNAAIVQPPNLPLDTELRSASPDLGLPESAESGGSGTSGGSSGLTDWEIVPSQSQMTHSRSNSLDNNVNIYSSQSDNHIDGPAGESKDGGLDRSIPESSGAADENIQNRAVLSTTQDGSKPVSLVNPPPLSSINQSSVVPPPSIPQSSGMSEGVENPFRRIGPPQSAALSQPFSSGADATTTAPVLSRGSRPDSGTSIGSAKLKSVSALPNKPKLSSEDGAPRTREKPTSSQEARLPSNTTKKGFRLSEDESLSSQRRHQSAFQPVHRVRQTTVSPATTLWENSDNPTPSNILLAPAMPLIIPALNPYSSSVAATSTTDVASESGLKKSSSGSSISERSRVNKEQDDQLRGRYADRRGDRERERERPREREDANRSYDSLDELDDVGDPRDRSYRGGREPRSARDAGDRPGSRTDNPTGRGEKGYDRPSSRTDRPSSRNESYRDEGSRRYRNYYRDYGNSYYDERYDRPRSRPEENRGSRPSSRSGQDVDRPRSRTDYDREADYYYRDRNRGYYDNYGRHADYSNEDRERYYRYYRERESRYSRGYYEEYYGPNDYYGRGSRPHSRTDYARDYYSRGYGYEGYGAYYDGYGYDPYYGYGGYQGYEDSLNQAYDQGRMTPPKYSYPHVRACFGPKGQLVKVLPNRPADGQPAIVELQDVQSVLENCQETEQLQQFPGPLTRINTHKKDVLYFCQQKAKACMEDVYMVNRESAQLIWRLLELLIKQNGVVVGTDLSDLLLEGHEPGTFQYSLAGDRQRPQSTEGLDVMTEDSLEGDGSSRNSPAVKTTMDRTLITPSRQREDSIARFRHLLLYGRKKDALECAMKNNLWGHALFLASKMDTRTHASVMTRFANSAMKMNDPLQTLYQLMSGRQPASVTGVMDERWGDWRPHLAMILSNQTARHDLDRKSITTLGDTLASKGYLHASHFCYIMAQVPFGSYLKKSSKIVLIGANHYLPLEEFATPEVIQCTEVYEYAQSLNNPSFCLVHFQIFKYLYACKLVDHGMASEALMYCEVIATSICQYPTYFQPSFVKLVDELSSHLKYADPHRQHTSEDAEDPMWMQQLHNVVLAYENGTLQPASGSETPALYSGASVNSNDSREMTPYQPGEIAQYASGEGQGSGTTPAESTGYDAFNQQYQPQQQVQTEYQADAYQQAGAGDGTSQQGGGYAGTEAYQQQQYADPNNQQGVQHQQQPDYSQWQHQHQQHYGSYQYSTAYDSDLQQAPQHNTATDLHEAHQPPPSSQTSSSAASFTRPTTAATGFGGVDETGHQTDLMSSHTSSNFSHPAHGTVGDNCTPRTSLSTNDTEEDDDDEEEVEGPVSGFDYFGNNVAQKVVTPPHRYRTTSSSSTGSTRRRRTTSGSSTGSVKASPHKTAAKLSGNDPKVNQKANQGSGGNGGGSGWFGGLFSKFGRKDKNEMILPDDKDPSISWDPEKKKWINVDEPEAEEVAAGPPPKDTDLLGKSTAASSSIPAPPTVAAGNANRFSLKAKGARNQYVDVNNPKPLSVPQNLFNVMPTTTASTTMPQVLMPGQSSQSQSQQPSVDKSVAPDTSERSMNLLNLASSSQDTSQTPDPSQLAAAPPSMPVLFNPASLSKTSTGGTSSAAGPGLKYGQRRAYPRSK